MKPTRENEKGSTWRDRMPIVPTFTVILLVVLILLCACFLIAGIWHPHWLYDFLGNEKDSKKESLKFFGYMIGGNLIALGALMAYRRAKAMEDAAKAQAAGMEQQAKANELTEQGHRQERLKNGIEHLGHSSPSVRMGGSSELYHLARDSYDLRQTILDILCGQIRHITGEHEYQREYDTSPSVEIQNLLSLLFVQNHDIFHGLRINLSGSWLNGADLQKARLWYADLRLANLKRARLEDSCLQRANLSEVILCNGHLERACLQEANLLGSRMHGADLEGAQLQGASLHQADLESAFLSGADLKGADLFRSRLVWANLSQVSLQGAILPRELLETRDLTEANLQGASTEYQLLRTTFEDRIRGAIGENCSVILPDNHRAIVGSFTQDTAEEWIDNHHRYMAGVPELTDSSSV